ncbi:hypothetical protein [Bradyrhizobium sp. NAS96.2]|uniref:hypothetical protein n=1 Tax=Bradyrhizobium sp. NAS96.2 TaxID=1680160 RepID=UPI001160F94A|nr:hypothetical protein [Bradyrhizobium sp. NAS96.2]
MFAAPTGTLIIKQGGLANLLNGFSKWPEQSACRRAAIAIGPEVLRRWDQIASFIPQDLTNLVNGFSKWPEKATSRHTTVAVANEILGRVTQLSQFTEQDLSSLVNGFSKWPEEPACRQATVEIASEVVRCADYLPDYPAGICESGEWF